MSGSRRHANTSRSEFDKFCSRRILDAHRKKQRTSARSFNQMYLRNSSRNSRRCLPFEKVKDRFLNVVSLSSTITDADSTWDLKWMMFRVPDDERDGTMMCAWKILLRSVEYFLQSVPPTTGKILLLKERGSVGYTGNISLVSLLSLCVMWRRIWTTCVIIWRYDTSTMSRDRAADIDTVTKWRKFPVMLCDWYFWTNIVDQS